MESDDEIFGGDPGSDLRLMTKEWERNNQNYFKDAFVDGTIAGQDGTIQTAFNVGFQHGFLSNFILSKMRGILTALMAYHASYEGNPISDSVLFEAHTLMEEISSLEANAVAEDFLKMTLHQSNPQNFQFDELSEMMSTTSFQQCDSSNESRVCGEEQRTSERCCQSATSCCKQEEKMATESSSSEAGSPESGRNAHKLLTVEDVNCILLQCPQITQSINKCKKILKSLNWTDDMIDPLLC